MIFDNDDGWLLWTFSNGTPSLFVRVISQMVQYVSYSTKDAILAQQVLFIAKKNNKVEDVIFRKN
jgi:hypothetical protein